MVVLNVQRLEARVTGKCSDGCHYTVDLPNSHFPLDFKAKPEAPLQTGQPITVTVISSLWDGNFFPQEIYGVRLADGSLYYNMPVDEPGLGKEVEATDPLAFEEAGRVINYTRD